jgi:hypothetical protein
MRLIDEQGDEWVTEEPTAAPTPKVATAGIAGALAILAVWVAGLFDVDMTAEVGAAIAAVLAFLGGYMKRDESRIEWADDGHADMNGLLWALVLILAAVALVVWIVNNT